MRSHRPLRSWRSDTRFAPNRRVDATVRDAIARASRSAMGPLAATSRVASFVNRSDERRCERIVVRKQHDRSAEAERLAHKPRSSRTCRSLRSRNRRSTRSVGKRRLRCVDRKRPRHAASAPHSYRPHTMPQASSAAIKRAANCPMAPMPTTPTRLPARSPSRRTPCSSSQLTPATAHAPAECRSAARLALPF